MTLKPYSVHEKQINGHSYQIMSFKAREGLHLLARIAYYASNILKIIPIDLKNFSIRGLLDTGLDNKLIDNIVDALQASFIDDEKIVELIINLVRNCSRDGMELRDENVFDNVFAENFEELFVLIKEVIVINFLSQGFMRESLKKQITTQAEKDKKPLPKNG